MSNKRKPLIRQTAKAALITSVAVALMLPGGLAAAADSSSSVTVQAVPANAAQAGAETPDPAEAKVTQEQAVAKVKALFPVLKDATVSYTQLGSGNSYPMNPDQLTWNIQWEFRTGSSTFGFSSEVDAMTGDLISTYLYSPFTGQADNFYPPKVTRAEALEKAKSFISQAAPTLKSSDLQQDENIIMNESALFGPVQYSFYFNLLVNGLPSSNDSVRVTIDGGGNVMQFNKTTSGLKYPSAKPAVSKEQAEKIFKENFDVALYYTPVYKKGEVDTWVLGWRPQNEALYPIDAQTGKRIDYEGSDVGAVPVVYEAVPAGKEIFKPVTGGKELTVDEAVKQVKKVAAIPANRKLIGQTLSANYQNGKQKVWSLVWSDTSEVNMTGMPGRTYAEVNATTGEVLQFQVEQYSFPLDTTQKAEAVPAGSKKLSQAEAKQQALSLINRVYDQASSNLKLAEHGGTWSVLPNDKGYRFEFQRYYDNIPVSENAITIALDLYGKLQSYQNYNYAVLSKITKQPAPVVTKAEALQKYLSLYSLKLQYSTSGGYFSPGGYTDPTVSLVYSPALIDVSRPYDVLNAQTGKWFAMYDYNLGGQSVPADSVVDIKGHAAEKQLAELLKYGVIAPDAEGKLSPDQVISVGDWLNYIAKASTPYYTQYTASADNNTVAGVSPDSLYYGAVNYAVSRSWLDKDAVVKPEDSLTREQLAVLLASFLKYSKLAAFLDNDATVTSFSDSTSIKDKGAVALVVRLGLLQGDNGRFNPQQQVTKAQAAAVIMKLVELQGKTDTAIGQQYM
ncbi:Endo-1,4-beta-xylanase A precursor [compost metagenome]